ncbi:MAG TPA: hypothetical protein DDW76_07465 [Cyanobacteria bacterium UBA11369]|nr:hypothetical protein [Cyanobacteria bacterium UBA11371]HBE36406.1 hypothetical protein [Cyanobacteria bacterium UBA11368]HBE48623.1 hypothetical protein [Cyanobacteria bacterium UBA11369]
MLATDNYFGLLLIISVISVDQIYREILALNRGSNPYFLGILPHNYQTSAIDKKIILCILSKWILFWLQPTASNWLKFPQIKQSACGKHPGRTLFTENK